MTAVLNILIPLLAAASILAAIFFVIRAIRQRSRSSREAYGVGRQEARQSMLADLVRGVAALFVGLIFLGVFGLSARPAALGQPAVPSPSPSPTTLATATATPAPLLATATPTEAPVQPTATDTPEPTETPTPEPTETPVPVAVVTSEVGVWLRVAPGVDTEQIERLPFGAVLTVLPGRETLDDLEWQQVRTAAGVEGWVAVEFITFQQ